MENVGAQRVTVVVVDDHPFFRDGVSRGLTASGRVSVVGEAGDGRSALEVIREKTPDVAVVDYQMPDMNGVDVAHAVTRDGLPTKVLLLSAVERVAKGETVIPPELATGLVDQIRAHSTPAPRGGTVAIATLPCQPALSAHH